MRPSLGLYHPTLRRVAGGGLRLQRGTRRPAVIKLIGQLYQVEREAQLLAKEEHQPLRDTRVSPIATHYAAGWRLIRMKVPNGSATAKALDYSLRRWSRAAGIRDTAGAAS